MDLDNKTQKSQKTIITVGSVFNQQKALKKQDLDQLSKVKQAEVTKATKSRGKSAGTRSLLSSAKVKTKFLNKMQANDKSIKTNELMSKINEYNAL